MDEKHAVIIGTLSKHDLLLVIGWTDRPPAGYTFETQSYWCSLAALVNAYC